jgi:hypothetical protein
VSTRCATRASRDRRRLGQAIATRTFGARSGRTATALRAWSCRSPREPPRGPVWLSWPPVAGLAPGGRPSPVGRQARGAWSRSARPALSDRRPGDAHASGRSRMNGFLGARIPPLRGGRPRIHHDGARLSCLGPNDLNVSIRTLFIPYLAGRFLRASALSSASCSPADRLAIFGSEDAEDADWERDLATWQAACDHSRLTSGRR